MRITLVGHWKADGSAEVDTQGVWTGITDINGTWAADLPAQSTYEGSTWYLVDEYAISYTVTVADTPSVQLLRFALMTPVPVAAAVGVKLDDLTDVSTAGATSGQALVYGPGGLWAPGSVAAGGGGSARPFDFNQTIPATQWNITHGLGQIPQVTVTDPTGHWMLSDLLYSGTNSIVITHGAPTAGLAHLLVASGVAIPYQFNQNSPAATWPVPHGLGRIPQVVIVDTGGNRILADLVYPDNNSLVITHGAPLAGSAYLL